MKNKIKFHLIVATAKIRNTVVILTYQKNNSICCKIVRKKTCASPVEIRHTHNTMCLPASWPQYMQVLRGITNEANNNNNLNIDFRF